MVFQHIAHESQGNIVKQTLRRIIDEIVGRPADVFISPATFRTIPNYYKISPAHREILIWIGFMLRHYGLSVHVSALRQRPMIIIRRWSRIGIECPIMSSHLQARRERPDSWLYNVCTIRIVVCRIGSQFHHSTVFAIFPANTASRGTAAHTFPMNRLVLYIALSHQDQAVPIAAGHHQFPVSVGKECPANVIFEIVPAWLR